MENKKSFYLYKEWEEIFTSLTNEQAGQFIKAIFSYCDKGEYILDASLSLLFIPIRQQLDRDTAKWLSVVERNHRNGLKGGRPKRNPKNPVGILGSQNNPEEPKKPDKDKDKDKDKEYIDIKTLEEIGNKYNLPFFKVREKYEKMSAWLEEVPARKKGRNYKLTLMNWIRGDIKTNQEKVSMPIYRGEDVHEKIH